MSLNLRLLSARVFESLSERGLRGTLGKVFAYLKRDRGPDAFDQAHGTNTAGTEQLWQYNIASSNARYGVRYQPTDEQALQRAVSFLREDLQNFTFIDLGCGKGRMLLQAAQFGFRQVIGVEFASELVEIAKSNAAKLGAANISVVHGDASEFHFPAANLVIYLFNPFEENVMRGVVSNLEKVTSRLFVIYNNPRCADLFDNSKCLERAGTLTGGPFPIVIWKSTGGDESRAIGA